MQADAVIYDNAMATRTVNRISVEHDIPLDVARSIYCTAVLTFNASANAQCNAQDVAAMAEVLVTAWHFLAEPLQIAEIKLFNAAKAASKMIAEDLNRVQAKRVSRQVH